MACSVAAAFGIGCSSSANELACKTSVGAGAAWAAPNAPSVATAPNSPAILFSILSSNRCPGVWPGIRQRGLGTMGSRSFPDRFRSCQAECELAMNLSPAVLCNLLHELQQQVT